MARKILLLLLLLAVNAEAAQRVLTSDSLPYAAASNDTISISGTSISSATHGILIRDNAVNVLLNLGEDTLIFGTGGAGDCFGIALGRYSGNCGNIIRGGYIIFGGDSTDQNISGISNYGMGGAVIESTHVELAGIDVIGIDTYPHEGYAFNGTNLTTTVWRNEQNQKNDTIRYCTIDHSNVHNYTYRMAYYSAGIRCYKDPAVLSEAEYHWVIYGNTVLNAPGQGIVVYGRTKAHDNRVIVDARNFQACSGTCNTSNAYAFIVRAYSTYAYGSEFYNNFCSTGTQWYGGDGGFEVEGCQGTVERPILFHNNTIYAHRGWDCNYGSTIYARGFKIRRADEGSGYYPNKNTYMYENEIHVYARCDDSSAYRAYNAFATGFVMLPNFDELDTNIRIYNNEIYSFILDTTLGWGSFPASASGFVCIGPSITDTLYDYWDIYSNIMYTNHACFRPGQSDPGGHDYRFKEDTCHYCPDSGEARNFALIYFYPHQYDGNVGDHQIRDMYAEPDTCWYQGSWAAGLAGDRDYTIQKTLEIYVIDSNSEPVSGATVVVKNAYSQTVMNETTDSLGIASEIITAYYGSPSGDSSGFFPCSLWASYNGDTAITTNSFTKNDRYDTLALQQTEIGGSTPRHTKPKGKLHPKGKVRMK